MGFLEDNCKLSVLTEEIRKSCAPYTCGKADMDEFFCKDYNDYAFYMMGKSYCFRLDNDMSQIVCAFTLSNDSIRINDLPRSRKDFMKSITHHEKALRRYPGLLLGRLAVAKEFAGQGIGSEVLTFIKYMFIDPDNKTGCRFLIVDAVNSPEVLSFYEKNGFHYLFTTEKQEELYTFPPKNDEDKRKRQSNPVELDTRLMYFDLLEFRENF